MGITKESKEHEDGLADAIRGLEKEGYRVIKTHRKIPDAIAAKDGKIFAVEMMGQKWTPNDKWENTQTKAEKQRCYGNFDGLLYFTFRYKKRINEKEESEDD